MEYNILIDEISKKYNYSKSLKTILLEIIPVMIKYYGNENLIFKALEDTPILLCDNNETIYDLMLKHMIIDDNTIVKKGDYMRASGVYCSDSIIENNKIIGIKRFVGIKSVDGINKKTLVHELGHLFKSYFKTFEISNDILIERSGLVETKYKLENNKKTVISETGVGLEEGINCYDEDNICSLLGLKCGLSGYTASKEIAKILMNEHSEEIRNEQFYKEGNYRVDNQVLTICDEIVALEYEKFANIFNKEKMLAINEILLQKMAILKPLLFDSNEKQIY
ncbi:MAG: hypothetical protein RSB71_00825 [Bacilli bacterium]